MSSRPVLFAVSFLYISRIIHFLLLETQGALTLVQLPSAQYLGFFTAALVRLLLRGGVYCFTASTVDLRWFGRVAGAPRAFSW